MPLDPEIESLIKSKEFEYNLPNGLLFGLVLTESSGNPKAYNQKTGASGLTQIIQKYHPTVKNPFDINENLDYAAKTLKRYSENFGSYQAAVAAWHSGEGRVSKNLAQGGDGIPGTKDVDTGLSTRNYVAKVLNYVDDLSTPASVPADYGGAALQDRPFNRKALAIIGLGMVLLGAFVVAAND